MNTKLIAERAYLEDLLTSKTVGFCFLDADRKLVQVFSDDPHLKEALVEYQSQRVRELEMSLK